MRTAKESVVLAWVRSLAIWIFGFDWKPWIGIGYLDSYFRVSKIAWSRKFGDFGKIDSIGFGLGLGFWLGWFGFKVSKIVGNLGNRFRGKRFGWLLGGGMGNRFRQSERMH